MQTGNTKKQQLWAVASIERELLQLLAAQPHDVGPRLPSGAEGARHGEREADSS